MSIRDKYNKGAKEVPARKTVAEELLQNNVNTEIQTKKATFVLDAALHTQLKTQAALEGRNMADIVSAALIEYLSKDK
mgnify:CR=1 FL=1